MPDNIFEPIKCVSNVENVDISNDKDGEERMGESRDFDELVQMSCSVC